ncbi:MAG TPA: hypothetical protein VGZ52_00005 [Acidimicrobiales bacterium]|jgi:hypothetical protein|nr:hypothetical protein [Acidimicrobiales bacterium]
MAGRRNDDRVLRRTQRTIAVVRASFAVATSLVIVGVLLSGQHNQDAYELPGVSATVRLWQALGVALGVLAIVFVGAVGEYARASRRRHFDT